MAWVIWSVLALVSLALNVARALPEWGGFGDEVGAVNVATLSVTGFLAGLYVQRRRGADGRR